MGTRQRRSMRLAVVRCNQVELAHWSPDILGRVRPRRVVFLPFWPTCFIYPRTSGCGRFG